MNILEQSLSLQFQLSLVTKHLKELILEVIPNQPLCLTF